MGIDAETTAHLLDTTGAAIRFSHSSPEIVKRASWAGGMVGAPGGAGRACVGSTAHQPLPADTRSSGLKRSGGAVEASSGACAKM